MVTIKKATEEDSSIVAPLLNNYRIFYKQEPNLKAAENFLIERLSKNQSHIFIAFKNNIAVGFTQLYTSYSSVALQPLFILNDLYVDNQYRGNNIGTELLKKAQQFCKDNKHKGLVLETATNNPAQKLYEKLNWEKDTASFHYFWTAK
ncbi:GNAT family N-acetyltransferase [Cellulophaga lytica]|uniref:GNAT family N-acetyltransferase n=1 Tax=Cellulophaga lytica TaxID=979 RepID=UPI0032E3D3E3